MVALSTQSLSVLSYTADPAPPPDSSTVGLVRMDPKSCTPVFTGISPLEPTLETSILEMDILPPQCVFAQEPCLSPLVQGVISGQRIKATY